jgi:hypothetical protein
MLIFNHCYNYSIKENKIGGTFVARMGEMRNTQKKTLLLRQVLGPKRPLAAPKVGLAIF